MIAHPNGIMLPTVCSLCLRSASTAQQCCQSCNRGSDPALASCTSTSNALGRPGSSLPNSEHQWMTAAYPWRAQQGVLNLMTTTSYSRGTSAFSFAGTYTGSGKLLSAQPKRGLHGQDLPCGTRQEHVSCTLRLRLSCVVQELLLQLQKHGRQQSYEGTKCALQVTLWPRDSCLQQGMRTKDRHLETSVSSGQM